MENLWGIFKLPCQLPCHEFPETLKNSQFHLLTKYIIAVIVADYTLDFQLTHTRQKSDDHDLKSDPKLF